MMTTDASLDTATRRSGETTKKLVDRIMALRAQDMPEGVAEFAKMFLLDTLATGVAGTVNPASDRVKTAAQRWDGGRPGACAVLGRSGERFSPHSAAVLNGFQIHCLEWDGLHEPSVVIALCTPMAAIVSETQLRDSRLDEVVFAFAVGVEIAVFFGAAAAQGPRFFRPSAAGLMGAVVALGILRRFDAAAMTRALGLAYSQVSGTMQAHWEGAEALPLQIGVAARAALSAADLAELELSAPHDFVDGKFGYFTLIEPDGSPLPHIEAIGKPWKITEVAHKPFPAGRATQATLTALLDLLAQDTFSMDDVVSITAYVPPLTRLLVGRPYDPAMEGAYARLCLACIAPMMVRYGKIDPRRFNAQYFGSEQAIEDAAKVQVALDDNTDANALGPQRIVVRFASGETVEKVVDMPFGSPTRPMTRADQVEKARFCFDIAGFDGDPSAGFAAIDEADASTQFRDILHLFTHSERA